MEYAILLLSEHANRLVNSVIMESSVRRPRPMTVVAVAEILAAVGAVTTVRITGGWRQSGCAAEILHTAICWAAMFLMPGAGSYHSL